MKLAIIPTVYVPVGLPASGKSYWWEMAVSKKLLPPPSSKRIHIDVIRSDLSGDTSDHSKDELVNKVALSNLKIFLCNHMPIIYYDDLNIDRARRLQINKISKKHGYRTTAIIFDTDINVCISRLRDSTKKIPLEMFEQMSRILNKNPVDYDEGWDDIIVVKNE